MSEEIRKIPRCAICGSNDHNYTHHYPVPSERLYRSLKRKWEDFVSSSYRPSFVDPHEDPIDIYDEAVDRFCNEYGYKEGLKEMVFHDYWYDTFADILYQKLEENEYDDSKLMTCPRCGFRTDSEFIMERHACKEKVK